MAAMGMIGVLVASLLTLPSPAGWPQGGYDTGNTAANSAEHTITASTVSRLRARWTVRGSGELSCARQSAPVVAGNRFAMTDASGVGGYDAPTGRRLWLRQYADPTDTVTPLLAVDGTTVLAGWSDCQSQSDPDGHLVAYDLATGKVRWKLDDDAPVSAMVIRQGLVAISGEDAGHAATTVVRIADGHQVWQRLGVLMGGDMTAAGDLMLTTTGPGIVGPRLEAAPIATGRPAWMTIADVAVVASDGRRLYATTPAGDLSALNPANGTALWSVAGAAGELATDGRTVYVARDTAVTAYAAGGGRRQWRVTLADEAQRPILAGGVLYVAAKGGRLTALNPATGRAYGFRSSGPVAGHAVVANGRLYVSDGRTLATYTR